MSNVSPDSLAASFNTDLDGLCERWVSWTRTRRLYGPKPAQSGTLGRIYRGATRPFRPGLGDAVSSAELAAFHMAYLCQPDSMEKRVFELYYVERVKPVKVAAELLGISRKHFYKSLSVFRVRLDESARAVLSDNLLPQRKAASITSPDEDCL